MSESVSLLIFFFIVVDSMELMEVRHRELFDHCDSSSLPSDCFVCMYMCECVCTVCKDCTSVLLEANRGAVCRMIHILPTNRYCKLRFYA